MEEIRNYDHCYKDAHFSESILQKNHIHEMVTLWDFWLLAQIYKDNGTNPHSEDQLSYVIYLKSLHL